MNTFIDITSAVGDIKEKSFGQVVGQKIDALRSQFPGKIFTIDELPDSPRNPSRQQILREISRKLTSYYSTPIDALSWFIVLYHGDEVSHRQTYRDIESLLRDLGCSHTGKDGQEKIYNNTSIGKLLGDCGWESTQHTDHTSHGKQSKAIKRGQSTQERVLDIVNTIKSRLPKGVIITDDRSVPTTVSATSLITIIEAYCPEICRLGTRTKSKILNTLTNTDRFKPDSFRDRSSR